MSFYENRQEGGRAVQPRQVYEFSLEGRRLMALGCIYSIWINPADENDHRFSCSIITTEPNTTVGEVHNRMPFIVPPEMVGQWLDREFQDVESLRRMIRPYEGRLVSARARR